MKEEGDWRGRCISHYQSAVGTSEEVSEECNKREVKKESEREGSIAWEGMKKEDKEQAK